MGPASKTDLGSGTNISTFSSRTSPMGLLLDQPVGYNNALPKPNPELERIAQRIEESLSYQLQNTDLKDHLRLIYDDRGLIIRFSAGELFEPGSADVKTKHLPTIDAIGNIIADGQRLLRVEGHTDSSPITNNPKFDTNWELSSARAAWIVRYLKAKWKIPSSRLAAAGYADGQPVASNKTEEGRARNRRVEIVVTNVIDRSQN